MSRLIQTFSKVSHDSLTLSRALWNAQRRRQQQQGLQQRQHLSSIFKPVLLEQASKNSNRVALSILKMDKEIGLVRYWGWMGYIRQRVRPLMTTTTTPTTTSIDDNDNSDNKKKIAFMITTSMKQELQDTYKYTVDDVKKMTPLQASLVLNHQISPEDYDDKVPALQEEHEKEQEQVRLLEKENIEIRQQEEEEEQRRRQQQEKEQQMMTMKGEYILTTPDSATSSSASPEVLAAAIGIQSEMKDTWYEVVEVKPNGERIRQGLYPNTEEAQEGLETREMIRDRQKEKDEHRHRNDSAKRIQYSTFEICEISRGKVLDENYQPPPPPPPLPSSDPTGGL
jgi:hypothetical protein